jgi:small ligand-binding sensory domain FIST
VPAAPALEQVDEMRWASSITSAGDCEQAVDELLAPIEARVTPGEADLVLLFSSPHFEDELDDVVDRLSTAFPTAALMGCTACGTIGCDQEIESAPSMSLLVGSLPGVVIRPFRMEQSQLEKTDSLYDWERIVGVSPDGNPTFLAFGDPFRFNIPGFIEEINRFFPGAPLVGGVASAAQAPEQNRLIHTGEIYREGIVGVAITGNLTVDTVVSQGCRPIGKPFVITKGQRNVILELGGHAPLEKLHDVLVSLSDVDERLAKEALLVGRVIDERKETFSRGDFLVHNIIGVDRASGAMGIAGFARVGTTVQFHVRDSDSADDDLRTLLAPYASKETRGAMLFGCNGRGTNMWDKPGHDAGVVREILGDVPLAGFFCGGEFGPIGGTNFLHAFTASIALFSEPTPE